MLKAEGIAWVKNKKQILKHIDFEIKKGECVGLVGPNGSGKSSLLKILALLQPPTTGKIYFNNQQIPSNIPLEIRRKIAVVFQEPLLLNMNVYQNIALGLKLRNLPKGYIQDTVAYWLDTFGITHLQKRHVSNLSGGEAQRTSLARAFALHPEVLLMDEPFSALDAPTIEELLSDLNRIFQSTGITTLIVSHNFREIQCLTTRTCVIQDGEIKTSGWTKDILSKSQQVEYHMSSTPWTWPVIFSL